ncbi:hypothetical protein C8J57DRAFT_1286321, partial [Mycena rebaudengoi]
MFAIPCMYRMFSGFSTKHVGRHPRCLGPQGQAIYLIGHSCGAYMLPSVFLDSSAVSLTPPPAVLQAVKGIAMS